MKVNTFNMEVFYIDGTTKLHNNISRVAVKRYKEYYMDTLFVISIIVKENVNV